MLPHLRQPDPWSTPNSPLAGPDTGAIRCYTDDMRVCLLVCISSYVALPALDLNLENHAFANFGWVRTTANNWGQTKEKTKNICELTIVSHRVV